LKCALSKVWWCWGARQPPRARRLAPLLVGRRSSRSDAGADDRRRTRERTVGAHSAAHLSFRRLGCPPSKPRFVVGGRDQIFGSQDFLENGVAWHRRPGSSKPDDTDLTLADASREDPNGHPGVVHRSFLSEPVSERRFLSEKRLANIVCIIEFTELEPLNDGPDKGTPFERRFLSPYACVQ